MRVEAKAPEWLSYVLSPREEQKLLYISLLAFGGALMLWLLRER